MDNTGSWLIKIAAAAITQSPADTKGEEEIHWDRLYESAKAHSVAGLLAYALGGFETIPEEIKQAFEKAQLLAVFKGENQQKRIGAVLREFEENKIDAMPLKGFVLKDYYPQSDMRTMCDADILIKEEDYPRAREIMEQNGFAFKIESAHEYVFTDKDVITVELHKTLVPNYNKRLFGYYGNGWGFAKKKSGYDHLYEMSAEDFYVYNVVHAAKHYLKGGIGVRQVIDIWVLEKRFEFSESQWEYMKEQFGKIGIERFAELLHKLAGVWLAENEPSELTDSMAEYILSGGQFGTKDRLEASEIYTASEGGYKASRIKRLFRAFCPTLANMQLMYPVLKKAPFLYPAYLVKRAFEKVLFKRDNIKTRLQKESEAAGEEFVSEFAAHCESVGIDRDL